MGPQVTKDIKETGVRQTPGIRCITKTGKCGETSATVKAAPESQTTKHSAKMATERSGKPIKEKYLKRWKTHVQN